MDTSSLFQEVIMSYETFKKGVIEKHSHTKSIVRYGIPRIKKDDPDMYKFIGGCTHNKEEFENYAKKLYHETGIRFVLVKTWKPYFLFWKRRYFYFLASHPFNDELDVCKNMEELLNRPSSFNQDKPWKWVVIKTFI